MKLTSTASVLSLVVCVATASVAGAQESAPALFGPATERSLAPTDAWRLPIVRADRKIKNAYPLYVNRRAIDSETLIADVDGTKYRFVGKKRSTASPPMDFWTGQTSAGDRADLTRTSESVVGSIQIGGRVFRFGGQGEYVIFFEQDLNPRPQTPEEWAKEEEHVFAAERMRRAARNLPPLLAPNEKAERLISPLDERELPAAEQERAANLRANPKVRSVTPIRINGSALNSAVIAVYIDGVRVLRGAKHGPDKFGGFVWSGLADNGARLVLAIDANGMVGGQFEDMPRQPFITGTPPFGLLTEWAQGEPTIRGGGLYPADPAASGPPARIEPVPPVPWWARWLVGN